MILTESQADAIRAAGGKVLNAATTRDWKRVAALPQGVEIRVFNQRPIRVDRTNADGEMLTTWFTDPDTAIAFAAYESQPWPLRVAPRHAEPAPRANVLQFPRRTRLGAIESWLQDHAGQAGNAVARIMLSLADLARRADNARKARRNG